jgi:hypothetical protein
MKDSIIIFILIAILAIIIFAIWGEVLYAFLQSTSKYWSWILQL